MRWVLSRLTPDCNLYGFDSFEGLPSEWYYGIPKGEFKVGDMPSTNANNVRFVKGWFEETLVPFLASTQLNPRLILHMDADLYAPTIYVLRKTRDLLIPGTIVIFDEYWFVKDEWRALRDFERETGKKFEYIAMTDTRAAIRFIS